MDIKGLNRSFEQTFLPMELGGAGAQARFGSTKET
jgi:hypothetical protein